MKKLFFLLAAILTLPQQGMGGEFIHHELVVTLDPAVSRLEVEDTVTLPDSLPGGSVSFSLHGGLSPRSPTPGVRLQKSGTSGTIPPVESFSATLPDGLRKLVLRYGGVVDHPLEEVGEEYARGQRRTAGRIFSEGAYLSESSFWYPHFGDGLMTFSLQVSVPPAWDVVSQGSRTEHLSEDGSKRARWESPQPQDSIYLLAGPYVEYLRDAGRFRAMVFLRRPDEVLANRYLEATVQYVRMYEDLIGEYPYGKFALVENFWETGYGMPSFTLLGPKIIRFPFILHSSFPHEILHNWWGNSVYVDYEGGNWGEGLTAYLSDHLIKEQRGQGAEYRLTALQKYADYVRAGRDLPLTGFRSRHGSVSEAVGYGKSLMLFHMLRRRIGDDLFRRALQDFYRTFRFRTASFDDLRRSFEKVSGHSLQSFFEQWATRLGAPELKIEEPEVRRGTEGYLVRGELVQVQQDAEPFMIDVPLAVTMKGEREVHREKVTMSGRRTAFELRVPALPLRLDADPAFDVFRRPDAQEIPPALTQAFGAERTVILLPSSAGESTLLGYRQLAESLSRTGPGEVEITTDDTLGEFPPDRSVWLLGWENRFLPDFLSSLGHEGVAVGDSTVTLARSELPRDDHAFVVTARHPADPGTALLWVAVDNLEAIPGLGRKLPHYHKYSYLAFSGEEPTNIVKGRWPVRESPLSLILHSDEGIPAPVERGILPPRPPLAAQQSLFSKRLMMETVRFLSSGRLEGRGFGSPGLEEAARYIADKFALYGLEPGGDEGDGYFQSWQPEEGAPFGGAAQRNVIGYIPGSRADQREQSIVIGAHYDHLGRGRDGTDVRKGFAGEIHHGADDNASGIAVLLELARVLGREWKPGRKVVLAAFSGEEAGRLGSRHCVAEGRPFSAAGCLAMVNLDTVGRLEGKKLLVLGGSSASEWVHIFRGAGYLAGVDVAMVEEDLDASDHVSFHEAGIPAVQIFSGPHPDYHRPGDTADKIDADGLVRVASLVKEVIEYLAGREEPLSSSLDAGDHAPAGGVQPRGERRKTSLGTIPDFTYSGPGVRLEGTVSGSPAQRAGLREGDVIIGVGEHDVGSLRDLSTALRVLAPGERVPLTFRRNGEEMTIEVELGER